MDCGHGFNSFVFEFKTGRTGGDVLHLGMGVKNQLEQHAWYNKNAQSKAHPVGTKSPNPFGLHDMLGNVWEWVEDCYVENYDGAPNDGTARTSGDCGLRVVRGGSWLSEPQNLRVANRYRNARDVRYSDVGFRVARTLGP